MKIRKFICYVILTASLLSCSQKKQTESSQTQDNSKEDVKDMAGYMAGILSSGVGAASFSEAEKLRAGKITIYLVAGGIIGITGFLNATSRMDKINRTHGKMVVFDFAVPASMVAVPITYMGLNNVETQVALLSIASVLSSYAESDQLRRPFLYVSKKTKPSLSSGEKFKQVGSTTIEADKLKEHYRHVESYLSTRSDFAVNADGKILDDDFLQLAFLSEYLQNSKKGFSAKEFVRQIKLSVTLPYDLPKAEFEKQKITDPVARNIFMNRGEFRKMGLM